MAHPHYCRGPGPAVRAQAGPITAAADELPSAGGAATREQFLVVATRLVAALAREERLRQAAGLRKALASA